jgi:exodeoxyribonuclease VII small subunit
MQQQPTFEQAFAELNDTAGRLEEGGLTLEESLADFERGMLLYRVCTRMLDEAEQRVTRLIEEAALEEE